MAEIPKEPSKPLSIDLGTLDDPVGETEAVSLSEFVRRTAGGNALPKPEDPFSERDGWLYGGIGGAGFSTVLGVGLVGALYEHQPAGWAVAAIGAGGLVTMAILLKGHRLTVIHTAIACLVTTWVFLGYVLWSSPNPGVHDVSVSVVSPEKWPALTETQISALASRVRFIPPEDIVVACETLNCKDLADGIADILQKTPGWHVEILHHGGLDITGVMGIRVNPDEPATEALRDAIESTAGLAVKIGPDARKDLGNDRRTFLVVGTRPF